MFKIYDLKVEYSTQPNAVDATNPRFSWKLESDSRNVMQKSYHITAYSGKKLIWDSGIVESDESRFVRYEGNALQSRQTVYWQVKVSCRYLDEDDETYKDAEVHSETGMFQMGLLEESDWKAKWITAQKETGGEERKPVWYLRKSFIVKPGLKDARIYQTAHGLYESFMNGQITDDDKFKPGLTSYYYRIQYQTYDITSSLREGCNAWAVVLADGWWRGCTGGSVKNNFGYTLDYLGQIELTYEDGSIQTICSDETFKAATGGLLASDMLMGDIYDAQKEPDGWKLPEFDDCNWHTVHLTEKNVQDQLTGGLLAAKIATRSVPVREMEQFKGREFRDASGARVLDYGQNIAGYVKIILRNTHAGQCITFVHGETLNWDGNFTVANVNKTGLPVDAFQQITYICKGAEEECYQPSFSIFGFRYLLIEGYEGEIKEEDFTAKAVYSAMEKTADFRCSNELLNQLVANSRWSQKGNFMDVPVDCPTRERNAWTGDAQIYVRTACTFMNAYSFYEKWLQDQTLEQYASGKVGITFPSTSSVHNPAEVENMKKVNQVYEIAGPTGNGNQGEDAAGWGDAAVWLPYSVYLYYGDRQILENQYETARKWLEFELACAKEANPLYAELPQYQTFSDGECDADYIFDTKFHYGEWNEAFGIKEKVEQFYAERTGQKADASAKIKKLHKTKEEQLAEKQKTAMMVNYFITMKSKTGDAVVATAYMARSAGNVAEMAQILGKTEDAARYAKIARRIRKVYEKYLINEDGLIEEGHQAPYVRALAMKLCSPKKEPLVVKQLLHEVKKADYTLNTGFLSTPFLLPVLCEHGYVEEAYKILENEELPGWLYPIKKGLTTIPESWGGADLLEDSLNHYSYGAVCEFLFQYTAGIRPCMDTSGYKRFILEPVVGGTLTHAYAELETGFGKIISSWKIMDGIITYHCVVPVNTTAEVHLPDGKVHSIGSGSYTFQLM